MHRPPLPPTFLENIPGTHFCCWLSWPQDHSAARRIMPMKNSRDISRIELATFWRSVLTNCTTAWPLLLGRPKFLCTHSAVNREEDVEYRTERTKPNLLLRMFRVLRVYSHWRFHFYDNVFRRLLQSVISRIRSECRLCPKNSLSRRIVSADSL